MPSDASGQRWSTVETAVPYTIKAWDFLVIADTSGGGVTLTLPPAIDGATFVVRNEGGGLMTVVPDGADTIEGQATLATTRSGVCYMLIAEGGDWRITSSSSRAIGMMWRGAWAEQQYEPGDVVRDGEWTMIANKVTEDRAAPQPQGSPAWISGLGDTAPWNSRGGNHTHVITGARYTSQEPGYVTKARVWIPVIGPLVNYTVWVVTPDLVWTPLPVQNLVVGWNELSSPTSLLPPGTVFDLILVAESESGIVSFGGSWNYVRSNAQPIAGQIAHSSNGREMRVHETDADSVPHTLDLDNMGPGDTITAEGIEWTLISANKVGAVYTFEVSPAARIATDGLYSFTFAYAAAASIEWVDIVDHYVGDDRAQGIIGIDTGYIGVTLNENAYGVDIERQLAQLSPDWEVVATSD